MWLHVPSTSLVSAQEPVLSTRDLNSLCRRLAQSVTWRTKYLKPESWQRALRMHGWMTRLSGLTLRRSTVDSGADSWIASLADIRVSHSLLRDYVEESAIPAISGRTSQRSLMSFVRPYASSKTWPATSSSDIMMLSGQVSPAWAITLQKDCLRRLKLARRTFGKDSSFWPTPDTRPGRPNLRSNRVHGGKSLQEGAYLWRVMWLTPTTRDWIDGVPSAHKMAINGCLGRQVLHHSVTGKRISKREVLSPLFVEALMGWPTGVTDFTSEEMESSQQWRQKHSHIWQGIW